MQEWGSLQSYYVANPVWRNGERRDKVGIVVMEAQTKQTQSQLKQQDFHPSASSLLSFSFSLSPFTFCVHRQLLKEVPACKSDTKEKKEGFCKV